MGFFPLKPQCLGQSQLCISPRSWSGLGFLQQTSEPKTILFTQVVDKFDSWTAGRCALFGIQGWSGIIRLWGVRLWQNLYGHFEGDFPGFLAKVLQILWVGAVGSKSMNPWMYLPKALETLSVWNPRFSKIPWGHLSPACQQWSSWRFIGGPFIKMSRLLFHCSWVGDTPKKFHLRDGKFWVAIPLPSSRFCLIIERTASSLCDFVWCFRVPGGCWLQPFRHDPPLFYPGLFRGSEFTLPAGTDYSEGATWMGEV